MSQPCFWLLVVLSSAPAALRLVEHPWNLIPAGAMAIFAGVQFRDKRWAFAVPLLAVFASDFGLGLKHDNLRAWTFHPMAPLIYACYAVFIAFGRGVRGNWNALESRERLRAARGESDRRAFSLTFRKAGTLTSGTLAGAIVFFLVTNFGDWLFFDTYPRTWEGLLLCYEKGLPFFRNSLISEAVGVPVLFGLFEMGRAVLAPHAEGSAAEER